MTGATASGDGPGVTVEFTEATAAAEAGAITLTTVFTDD